MIDFTNIDYLKIGSPKQQSVYNVIKESMILQHLASYSPVLVGTFPLGIDIEGSDIDIACYYQSKEDFLQRLHTLKTVFNELIIQEADNHLLASFTFREYLFEIYGEGIPVKEQNGYIHMVNEHKALVYYGQAFKEDIIALKKAGYKTEPAFHQLLALQGDPYQAMLSYSTPNE